MRSSISISMTVMIMAAIVAVTTAPALGQDAAASSGNAAAVAQAGQEPGAPFIDLVPAQTCLLDDQGRMVFRVTNQGRVWTAPATTTAVSLSTGGAPFHVDFPTAPIPPGGSVDLPLGAGPADLGAHVVGFAVTADSTNQVGELNKGNNTVGWWCSDTAGGQPTLPSTGGLSSEWLYAMFGAAVALLSASFTAGVFGLRRIRARD